MQSVELGGVSESSSGVMETVQEKIAYLKEALESFSQIINFELGESSTEVDKSFLP